MEKENQELHQQLVTAVGIGSQRDVRIAQLEATHRTGPSCDLT